MIVSALTARLSHVEPKCCQRKAFRAFQEPLALRREEGAVRDLEEFEGEGLFGHGWKQGDWPGDRLRDG